MWIRGQIVIALLVAIASAHHHVGHHHRSDSSSGHHHRHMHHHRHHSPVIKSHAGLIRGVVSEVAAPHLAYEFTGIPYAEAPVEHRRFERPVRKHHFHHVFHADRPPRMCPQNQFPGREDVDLTGRFYKHELDQIHMSENCLTLSIWVPKRHLDEHIEGRRDETVEVDQPDSCQTKEDPPESEKCDDCETVEQPAPEIDSTDEPETGVAWRRVKRSAPNFPPHKELHHHHRHHHHEHPHGLPVLAFFQQGGYGGGNVTDYDGSYLAAFHNIIVVTIRFRVGLLGFAYRHGIHGNMGLWDQLLALRWIHRNIHAFGGSKHEVTIGGQGEASNLVSVHLLSPRSRHYFHRAILQSNVALSQLGVHHRHRAHQITDSFFHHIIEKYCSPNHDHLRCLKRLHWRVFTEELERGRLRGNRLPLLLPVIDDRFLHGEPLQKLHDNHYHHVPLLIGVTRDEGSQYVAYIPGVKPLLPVREPDDKRPVEFLGLRDYDRLMRIVRHYYSYPLNDEMFNAVRLRYWATTPDNGFPTGQDIAQAISSMVGDSLVTCPTLRWAQRAASRVHNVYAYQFSHRRAGYAAVEWMGVAHGSEVPFVFGEPLSPRSAWFKYDQTDQALSRVIMAYWANFVKYGTPNGRFDHNRLLPDVEKVKELRYWPRLDGEEHRECNHRYFDLKAATVVNRTEEAIVCRLKEDDCLFWNRHLVRLAKLDHRIHRHHE